MTNKDIEIVIIEKKLIRIRRYESRKRKNFTFESEEKKKRCIWIIVLILIILLAILLTEIINPELQQFINILDLFTILAEILAIASTTTLFIIKKHNNQT